MPGRRKTSGARLLLRADVNDDRGTQARSPTAPTVGHGRGVRADGLPVATARRRDTGSGDTDGDGSRAYEFTGDRGERRGLTSSPQDLTPIQQPGSRLTDRDGRRNSKDQNRPVRVTATRRLSLRARRSDASTRSGRTSTCTGLTNGAPRRVRMKAWRCGPLVYQANSIRRTRSEQNRGHEGQDADGTRTHFLTGGGLLMKAAGRKRRPLQRAAGQLPARNLTPALAQRCTSGLRGSRSRA